MIKKFIKTILVIGALISSGYILIFFSQNIYISKNIKKYIESFEYNKSNIIEKSAIRCNLNIFNPLFADVEYEKRSDDRYEHSIYFWMGNMFFNLKKENWGDYYIGATDIKNTTFPELVKMVKDDCYQFQEGHGDYYGDDLAWSYSAYVPETEEDIAQQKNWEREKELEDQKNLEEGNYASTPNEVRAMLREQGMPDELIEETIVDLFDESGNLKPFKK